MLWIFNFVWLFLWTDTHLIGYIQEPQVAFDAKVIDRDVDWVYDNRVYDEYIYTVQFYKAPYVNAYPVLYMDQTIPIKLEFDELMGVDERASDLLVDIISCDVNWEPSNVLPIEFYEGFTQDRILDFQRSRNTKVPYMHYQYTFPQQGEFFKKSGNYLLKVYRDNAKEEVIITRRFVVVEPRVGINLRYLLNQEPQRMELTRLGFVVNVEKLQVRTPQRDLNVRILQNFRWDNAVRLDQPIFIDPTKFEYNIDLIDQFPGGNEFRFHDIISLRLYSNSVREIFERDEVFDVVLKTDRPRSRNVYNPVQDLNGGYYIDVMDFPQPEVHADYVYNFFSLEMPKLEKGSVYVFGALTGWNTYDHFKMNYNDARNIYEAEILLKQGFYDYQYVILRDGEVDDASLEGKHRDTENFYSILVYFRGPMDRNDRLVGFRAVNYID